MGDTSQGLQGAAGGAMAGGSVAGPWGAGIGGVLGLLGGLFGSGGQSDYQQQLQDMATQFANRRAPQEGPAAQAGQSSLVANRSALISMLESMARGEGPSPAATQMKQAMDANAAAQASAVAGTGGRGVNQGAAFRTAANNTAAMNAQAANQTAILRQQEQRDATSQLSNTIGYGIQADNQLGEFNAGQQNDVSQNNLNASLTTMGLNQSGQLQALLAAMGIAGPGTGSQLLAGGATAVPALMQMFGNHASGGGIGATSPYPTSNSAYYSDGLMNPWRG